MQVKFCTIMVVEIIITRNILALTRHANEEWVQQRFALYQTLYSDAEILRIIGGTSDMICNVSFQPSLVALLLFRSHK